MQLDIGVRILHSKLHSLGTAREFWSESIAVKIVVDDHET
jgi:hypothetical protein